MSGTIVHLPASGAVTQIPLRDERHPFLVALGERVRALRTRRGMTRKALSAEAAVSERHLANLEYGQGNASVLVLLQVANALRCPLAELLDDGHGATHAAETRATTNSHGPARVALVGLRGAGKSTLGSMLAEDLQVPFIELSREVERVAGCPVSEIQALYGQAAYRRYERRALEETVRLYAEAVIAAPGGLVSEPSTYALLLQRCTTVWLQAEPEDHMQRVIEQGDLRPMGGSNHEAMADLRTILAGRSAFYAKASLHLNTSAAPLDQTFATLRALVRKALGKPEA
jgi:XRE family aerobic/anaerobic benzoate catabolism transcriptional regulator